MVRFSVSSKVLDEMIPGLEQIGTGHQSSSVSFCRGHCWRQPVCRVGAVLAEIVPDDCDKCVIDGTGRSDSSDTVYRAAERVLYCRRVTLIP